MGALSGLSGTSGLSAFAGGVPMIPWVPTMEPSLRLWLDPSDTTGWTLDGSGNPTAMRSKATTQDVFTLVSGTAPVLSSGVLTFTDASTRFVASSTLGLSADPSLFISFVGSHSNAAFHTFFVVGAGAGAVGLFVAVDRAAITYGGNGQTRFANPPDGGPMLDTFVSFSGSNRSTGRMRRDGTERPVIISSDGAVNVSGSYSSISEGSWTGTLDEMLAFNSTEQPLIERAEGYLAHKRGRASELPAAHPFKFSPPMVPVPAWSPQSLNNLMIWMDGADTRLTTGQTVTSWQSKGPAATNFTFSQTAKPTKQALYLNCPASSGPDNLVGRLGLPVAGALSVVALVAPTASGSRTLIRHGDLSYNLTTTATSENSNEGGVISFVSSPGAMRLVSFSRQAGGNYGSLVAREWGTDLTSQSSGTTTALTDSSDPLRLYANSWAGDIYGVVTWNGADLADVQKVEGYLAHSTGNQGLLAAGHPFKSSPP